jgi:hypothetical protein
LEIIPAEASKAATTQLEKSEPESSRAEEQSKLQSPIAMTGLSNVVTASAATPRKRRRMSSVLDAILKPSKVDTASTKVSEDKIEELGEASTASASPACADAGPSKMKLVEQVKESLPEKLTLPIPEVASRGNFGYIVCHASRKQLSEQQIAEVQYYANCRSAILCKGPKT